MCVWIQIREITFKRHNVYGLIDFSFTFSDMTPLYILKKNLGNKGQYRYTRSEAKQSEAAQFGNHIL